MLQDSLARNESNGISLDFPVGSVNINDDVLGEDEDGLTNMDNTDPDTVSIDKNIDIVQELQIMNIEDTDEYAHVDDNIQRTGTYLEEKNCLLDTVVFTG